MGIIMIRFLWNALMVILLFEAMSFVIIGGAWVLRIAIDWWLGVDYVEKIKEWINK